MTDLAELRVEVDPSGLKKGEQGLDNLDKAGRRAETGISKASGALATLGKVAKGATIAALVAAPIRGVSAYKEFGKSIAEVNTLLGDGFEDGAIKQLEAGVRDLSSQFGGDLIANTQALYDIISAGAQDSATAISILTQANKLAIAGVTDVSTAADGLTSVLNSFSEQGLLAADAADSLFTAVRLGKTTIPELSSALGKVAPIAAAAGLSFDELNASIATITAGGVTTSEAVTGLKAALNGLLAPGSEASKLMAELGLNVGQSAIESQGFESVLLQLNDKVGNNVGLMKKLLGSTEAANAALTLIKGEAKGFTSALDEMTNKSGSVDQAFDKMSSGTAALAFRWEVLKSKITDTLVSTGEALSGPLISAIDIIAKAIGPLSTEIASFVDNLQHGDGVFRTVRDSIGFVGDAFSSVMEFLSPIAEPLAVVLATLVGGQATWALAAGGVGLIATAFKGLILILTKNPIATAITGIALAAKLIYDNWDQISGFFASTWESVKKSTTAAVNSVNTLVQEMVAQVKTLATEALQAGKDFVAGLVKGITGKVGEAVDSAKKLATSVIDTVRGLFKEQSPSKVMIETGKNVGKGLALGILLATPGAASAAEEMALSVSNTFGVMADDISTHSKHTFGVLAKDMNDALPSMREELEQTEESISDFSLTLSEDLGDSFAGAIVDGENFGDSMVNMAKRVVREWIASGFTKLLTSYISGNGADYSGFTGGGGGGNSSSGTGGTVTNTAISAGIKKGFTAIGEKYFAGQTSTGGGSLASGAGASGGAAAAGGNTVVAASGSTVVVGGSGQAASAAIAAKSGGVAAGSTASGAAGGAAAGSTTGSSLLGAGIGAVAVYFAQQYVGNAKKASFKENQKGLRTASRITETSFGVFGSGGDIDGDGVFAVGNGTVEKTNILKESLKSIGNTISETAGGTFQVKGNLEGAQLIAQNFNAETQAHLEQEVAQRSKIIDIANDKGAYQERELEATRQIGGEFARSINLVNSAKFDGLAAQFEKISGVGAASFKAISKDGIITAKELTSVMGSAAGAMIDQWDGASSVTVAKFLEMQNVGERSAQSIADEYAKSAHAVADNARDMASNITTTLNGIKVDPIHIGVSGEGVAHIPDPNDGRGRRFASGTGGKFLSVPPGFNNDNYPIFLQSGEEFLVRSRNEVGSRATVSSGGDTKEIEKLLKDNNAAMLDMSHTNREAMIIFNNALQAMNNNIRRSESTQSELARHSA